MKRLYLILLLAIALVPSYAQYRSGYQDLYDSETVSRLKEHVSYLASSMTEGRKAGSEGEAIAARYVSETLESYGVDLLSGRDGDVFGMLQPQGDTLRSRNVIGFVQGCDPQLRDRYIVVGARLDNLGTHSLSIDGVETTQVVVRPEPLVHGRGQDRCDDQSRHARVIWGLLRFHCLQP